MKNGIVVVLAMLGGMLLAGSKDAAGGFATAVVKAIGNVFVVGVHTLDLGTFFGIACIIGAVVLSRTQYAGEKKGEPKPVSSVVKPT